MKKTQERAEKQVKATKAAGTINRSDRVAARVAAIRAQYDAVRAADAAKKATYTRALPTGEEGALETHTVKPLDAAEAKYASAGARLGQYVRATACGKKILPSDRLAEPPAGVELCGDCAKT